MSRILGEKSVKTLVRFGDLMAPKNGEFPAFSELGCIEHLDDIIRYAPQDDIKDLNLLLSVLFFMPKPVLVWLLEQCANSHERSGAIGALFRQLDFAFKGIIYTLYYSGKCGKNYKGKTPTEVIGFKINRVPA